MKFEISPHSKWNTELWVWRGEARAQQQTQQKTMPSDEVEFRAALSKFMKELRYFARENLSNALMARRWSASPARPLALHLGRMGEEKAIKEILATEIC